MERNDTAPLPFAALVPTESSVPKMSRVPEGLPLDPSMTFNPTRVGLDFSDLAPLIAPGEAIPNKSATDATAVSLDDVSTPAMAPPTPPRSDAFTLKKVIGRGGFGEIWEGTQSCLGRVIAVKRLRDDIYERSKSSAECSEHYQTTFRHEALTTASLDHPNIVPVYDFAMDETNRPLLAMKLVRGKPWDHLIWDEFSGPVGEFLTRHVSILMDMAQAVAFAHSRGVVHRDLKPSQVMVGEFGEVLLMDWGLAIVYDELLAGANDSPLGSGVVPTTASAPNPAGTVAFMAPEQTEKDARHVGPWTDLYLLGATLYYILTRTPPHRAQDSEQAFQQARVGIVEPPSERAAWRDVPVELEQLAMKAMQPEIAARTMTVKEFIAALESWRSGAGKRAESEALIREVESICERGECEYVELGSALSKVERAAGLWPGNPFIDMVRGRVARHFGERALANGDLTLARVQSAMMAPTDEKRRLVDRIRGAERWKRTQTLLIRLFMLGTIASLVVVLLLLRAVNERSQEALDARVDADTERQVALQSRQDAEKLLDFLVADVHQGLTQMGRLDLLKSVADKTAEYYAKAQTDGAPETDPDALLRRTRALINIGEVQSQDRDGQLSSAGKTFAEALRAAEQLKARRSDDWQSDFAVARARRHLGTTSLLIGDLPRGSALLMQCYSDMAGLTRRQPQSLEVSLEYAKTALTLGQLEQARGSVDRALEYSQNAINVLEARTAPELADSELRQMLAQLYRLRGENLFLMGRYDEAMLEFLHAQDFLAALVKEFPLDIQRHIDLACVNCSLAELNAGAGNMTRAQELLAEVRDTVSRYVVGADANAEWSELAANLESSSCVVLYYEGRYAEAVEQANRFHAKVSRAAAADPEKVLAQTALATSYYLLGISHNAQGQTEAAIADFNLGLEVTNRLLSVDPGITMWRQQQSMLTIHRARAMMVLGTGDPAADFDTVIDAQRLLIKREPTNALYPITLGIAHTDAGRAAAARGDQQAARAHWEAAVAVLPMPAADKIAREDSLFLAAQSIPRLLLGRVDEARPAVEILLQRQFREPVFLQVAAESGFSVTP